ATTGTEAMEILRDAPVCLVLSDHMLRGTTGTFLAKQMKKIKRKVPIILYSGRPPESMRNVDGFINKDESVPRFLSLVGDFVKRYLGIDLTPQSPFEPTRRSEAFSFRRESPLRRRELTTEHARLAK